MSIRNRELQAEEETIQAIDQFEKEKKGVVKAIESRRDKGFAKEEVKKLKEKIEGLKDKLLSIEVELAEDVESNLKSFTNVLH